MKKILLTSLVIIFPFAVTVLFSQEFAKRPDFTSYVDPFIGTGGHGHTYPGASVPFGMVQVSPDTRLTGWDGCSGYHHSDSVIYGFSHTHLSGTGCSDYGDILIMPTTGKIELDNYKYSSSFKNSSEKAGVGYYSVFLDKPQVQAEMTATTHAGYHCYSFPETKNANFIIDLKHRDKVIESWIEFVGNNEIRGFRRSSAWAKDQYLYFVMKFSKPFVAKGISGNDALTENIAKKEGENIKAFVSFETNSGEKIYVKVGISAVSIEGAINNLFKELPDGSDFMKIRENARNLWNDQLSKITVEGGTKEQMTIFYTALYHCMLSPNYYTDVDGKYRGLDMKIHEAADFSAYTVFSIWDTYRALHPLFTIIDQGRTNDFIKTFLAQYDASGCLPVWELGANETWCMIGYHAASVITDAWIKGIRGFDGKKALEAMKQTSLKDHFGIKEYRQYGFLPFDKGNESVSRTLEYAYDDWCIAQMAKSLGENSDYETYLKSAQSYKNIFDPSTGFMRGKGNGMWYTPFNPAEVNNNYTEANSWQYSFYVPQDISGYASLLGGKDKLAAKIDELFTTKQKLGGRDQSDITGMIGQYAHGNEPSHHMAYLYNFVNQPWKTQDRVRQIMDELYTDKDDGLCGNEDCGQMSAWLVMSAMGFYQVCPGNPQYELSTPWFPVINIHLENGNQFNIYTKNVSQDSHYIQSATLNGETYNKCYIDHKTLMEGGSLSYVVGPNPNNQWGNRDEDVPKSEIKEYQILPVPYLEAEGKTFKDQTTIKIYSITPNASIFYTLDGTAPTKNSIPYKDPIKIKKTTKIKAIAFNPELGESLAIEAEFVKFLNDKSIIIKSVPGSEYTAGGTDALIDGIRGHSDFRLGGWQGYQGQDFEAVIDLGSVKPVHKISAGFCQELGAWIVMPRYVEYWTSSDGKKYEKVATIQNTIPEKEYEQKTKDFDAKVNTNCRYIKVIAAKYGKLPSWHLGAGGESWMFIDEIVVE